MDEFQSIHALYLRFFLDLPQFPNTLKQVVSRLSDDGTLVSFSIKSRVKHLQWLSMYDFLNLI